MSIVAHSRSATSSDLSRNPAQVFRAAEEGPVTITRRDGEPLILVRSSTIEQEHDALRLAANLVAASLAPGEGSFAERLLGPFPWLGFLPHEQREHFATEIVEVARACAAVSSFERLFVVLAEWRATAEAVAAGYTPDDQLEWLDDSETVSDPRAGE
ncbi:type II toxin-antitoxin system Phd/YefM family antitoxin [Arthrobacter sp. NyZ413]|uniref:type II toxin-antitoxin system Phd/YefM family antitoxin n=1 Tax=Arthrobacter sp. NyZ413 TaxID=3144669 RepID=UPI003BF80B97